MCSGLRRDHAVLRPLQKMQQPGTIWQIVMKSVVYLLARLHKLQQKHEQRQEAAQCGDSAAELPTIKPVGGDTSHSATSTPAATVKPPASGQAPALPEVAAILQLLACPLLGDPCFHLRQDNPHGIMSALNLIGKPLGVFMPQVRHMCDARAQVCTLD